MNGSRQRSGSMMLEFVLTMPVLVLLIMVVVQVSQIWMARQLVVYSAFCAARSVICANPQEHSAAAYNAARTALSVVTLPGGGKDEKSFVPVPGWGYVANAGGIDERRLSVGIDKVEELLDVFGTAPQRVTATVKYKFPLMVPVAGAMIGWYASGRSYKDGDWEIYGWTRSDPSQHLDGFPYIELTESCAVPLPYSTRNLPYLAY